MSADKKPIANIYEQELRPWKKGSRFEAGLARMGPLIGAEQLGCQYHVIPAGKIAYPRHAHHKNEELFFVLEGAGEYQAGDQVWPVRAGDMIAAPAGDVKTAHQLRNISTGELKYLVISTRHDPDVVEYADSGKFAVASRVPPDKGLMGAAVVFIGRQDSAVDYWDGEDVGTEE
jgi:uncharacterized cupin superfamily protein